MVCRKADLSVNDLRDNFSNNLQIETLPVIALPNNKLTDKLVFGSSMNSKGKDL